MPTEPSIFDAAGALTREYLLDRGYCCENGCRNCPYGFRKPDSPQRPARRALRLTNLTRNEPVPRRIVSLCPSNTEILHALGLMDRVVGVDDWSDWPESVRDIPRVGPDQQVSIERVRALKPDLVLASLSVPGMEWNIHRLETSGLPYDTIVPHGLDGLWDNIRQVGRITGTAARAEDLVSSLQHRITEVSAAADHAHRPRVYFEWWPKPLFAPGKRNWLTSITEIAGGISITGNVDAESANPSFEDVIAADPVYIFMAWTGVARERVRPHVLTRRPGWERIAAVRAGRVYVVDEGLFCRPSPRLIDGLELLASVLKGNPPASPFR